MLASTDSAGVHDDRLRPAHFTRVFYNVSLRFIHIACLLALSSLQAQDWPMYLRDATHTSYAATENLLNAGNVAQLAPLWRTVVSGPISTGVTLS
ncbi:MAG TPA: hypothetical protein VFA81_12215, partial [Burkholderiales bacterium]|nr:hypothetical protein [Burkholderiales bacterium]